MFAGQEDTAHTRARARMLDQVRAYGVSDRRVLAALAAVPRHLFLPPGAAGEDAYADSPCRIGWGATMSQPFIVAYMTELLRLEPGDRVLEIGTGSGYQAAVLAHLAREVYSVEIEPELVAHARRVLAEQGCANVQVRQGDGGRGWPEAAPFAAIVVTCAPAVLPEALPAQLAEGGRLVYPVGIGEQYLEVVQRRGDALHRRRDLPVRFVPMRTAGVA